MAWEGVKRGSVEVSRVKSGKPVKAKVGGLVEPTFKSARGRAETSLCQIHRWVWLMFCYAQERAAKSAV